MEAKKRPTEGVNISEPDKATAEAATQSISYRLPYGQAVPFVAYEKVAGGALDGLERHHIYGGANRRNSAKYGLWVWLRHDLHNEPPDGVHFNIDNNRLLQRIGQRAFALRYPDENFTEIFGRNYL